MTQVALAEELSDFVLRANSGIPREALAAGKTILLDCLGGTLGGASSAATEVLSVYLRASGGSGRCTVVGIRTGSSAEHAALANGLAGHVLDIDDTSSTMAGHPSVAALASSLAIAEAQQRSGIELVTAFVVGFEVQAKLAVLLPRDLASLGWHNCGTLGSIGAAASAAFLLRLDRDRTVNAIGAAASMACGLTSNVGSMVKPLHPGLAARNGVLAAELAALGFEAQRYALDGPAGFVQAFAGDPSYRVDPAALGSLLGSPYDVVTPGTDLKIYASCNCTHAAIDAALALRSRVDPAAIRKVTCRVPSLPTFILDRPPRNRTEGKFSLEYCVALALVKGAPNVDDFDDGPIGEGAVTDLMNSVRVEIARDAWEVFPSYALPAQITIQMADGSEVSESVDHARGSTQRPLTDAEIDLKFLTLAGRVLTAGQAKELLGLVRGIDRLADLSQFSRLLVPEPV